MLRLVDFWIKQRFRWGHFILCNLKISIVVQSLSCVRFSEIPWTAAYQASLSFSISWSLLKLMSTESMMPSIHFILCHSFLLLQSFPASGSFPMSQLFESGGQSIGVSASVLPMNIQGWFALGLTGFISLQPKGLSRVFSSITIRKNLTKKY